MEEKKMKVEKDPTKKSEKLTYEQLESVANELNMQCKQLYAQLQNAQKVISEFNDLGLLLEIIDKGEYFNSDFVESCTERVEKLVRKALDEYDKAEEKAKKAAEETQN